MSLNPYTPPTKVHSLILDKDFTRFDFTQYLADTLQITSEQLTGILHHGGVSINQERIQEIPPTLKEKTKIQIYRFLSPPKEIPLNKKDILYEDKNYLAFNKPAWLPTQGTRVSVIYSLENQLKELTGIKTLMAIHRLDRQTSGIVLFGKNSEATGKMMKQFSSRNVIKKYLARVSPPPTQNEWEVKGYLVRNHKKLPLDYFNLVADETKKGKFSHSTFKVLETKDNISLVQASPITGRTHQLRIHLASSGSPIIGDTVYGSFKAAKEFDNPRIQLHASYLQFPIGNNKIEVNAPLPEDFNNGKKQYIHTRNP